MQLYRFSYPISKPYPFQWFTPLVIVGGLVLTVLFSLLNYPANAFEMKIETTLYPIEFEKNDSMPSLVAWLTGDNFKPKCEPYDLSVGTQFFTTNKGFLYTVDKVYRHSNKTNKLDDVDQSVPYLSNPLEDCHPTKIIIALTKDDTAPPPTWWISWIGNSYFEAHATCQIQTREGPAKIDFSMKKSGVAKDEWDYIIDPNTNATFWWGAQLLNTYWFSTMEVLSKTGHFDEENQGFYNRGRFTFKFNSTKSKTIHDVDFHDFEFFLVSASTSYNFGAAKWKKATGRRLDDIYNNPKDSVSMAITEASYFAKIVHSFIVADLANPKIPNLLLEEKDLREFLSGKDDNINRQEGGVLGNVTGPKDNFGFLYRLTQPHGTPFDDLVLLNESWDAFKKDRGELGTPNATIYKKYACSGPRPKSWGRTALLILVADLVFLRTAWTLLKLVAGVLVERQEPKTAMVCEGCLKGKETGRETPVEMQNLIQENEEGQNR